MNSEMIQDSVYGKLFTEAVPVTITTKSGSEFTGEITCLDSAYPGGIWMNRRYAGTGKLKKGTFIPFDAVASVSIISD